MFLALEDKSILFLRTIHETDSGKCFITKSFGDNTVDSGRIFLFLMEI